VLTDLSKIKGDRLGAPVDEKRSARISIAVAAREFPRQFTLACARLAPQDDDVFGGWIAEDFQDPADQGIPAKERKMAKRDVAAKRPGRLYRMVAGRRNLHIGDCGMNIPVKPSDRRSGRALLRWCQDFP